MKLTCGQLPQRSGDRALCTRLDIQFNLGRHGGPPIPPGYELLGPLYPGMLGSMRGVCSGDEAPTESVGEVLPVWGLLHWSFNHRLGNDSIIGCL